MRAFVFCPFAIATALLLAGCTEPEGIRTYTVQRTEPAAKTRESSRMLAAIIPRGEEAWFFKLMGPDALVAKQAGPFENLIKSVRFSEGATAEPQWTLPPGWIQSSGNAMRFATLEIKADGQNLECSVSRLPRTKQPMDEYLLANINRWRGQLALEPITLADLPQQTTSVPLADEKLQGTLVNFVGSASSGGMSSPPFANAPKGPLPADDTGPRDSESAPKISYKAPTGWTPGQLESSRSGFSIRRDAVFEVTEGKERVEITVTKLPGAAGTVLPNVNRWRGQIGLDATSDEAFQKEKKQIELAGTMVDYVQLSHNGQTVLGVIGVRNGLAWFIKLQGNSALADRERANFEDFVRSIRFE